MKIINKMLGIKDIGFLAVFFVPIILVGIFVVYPAYENYVAEKKAAKQQQQQSQERVEV